MLCIWSKAVTIPVMVVEWVKAPAVWCDPWGMAGLRTIVKPLIDCTIIQPYSCQN